MSALTTTITNGLTVFAKEGDERLSEGVREDELGSDNQDLDISDMLEESLRKRSRHTFGVNPLKNDPTPSCLIISLMMVMPPTCELKLAFWIRVLTTSSGAATVMEATAPPIDATKSAISILS
jgi:hypothetical protein